MTSDTRTEVLFSLEIAHKCLDAGDSKAALRTLMGTIEMLAPAPPPARPPEQARGWLPGALVWRCSSCPQVLGLVVPAKDGEPARLMVKHFKREITVASHDDFEQKCDKCGCENRWPVTPAHLTD